MLIVWFRVRYSSSTHNIVFKPYVWLLIAVAFSERSQFDINSIPKIFLQANLDLSHLDTFKAVYPFSKDLHSPVSNGEDVRSTQRSEKLLQEKVGTITVTVLLRFPQVVNQK
jgi:hypothetical protein